MAVADAFDSLGLSASIKWPNDVLLQDRKVAGVLVEAVWSGDALDAAVVGIGINVLAASTPPVDIGPLPGNKHGGEPGLAHPIGLRFCASLWLR